ncbi:MAG: endolytic transglycosylase MltG [Patescibacteria group bacterium]
MKHFIWPPVFVILVVLVVFFWWQNAAAPPTTDTTAYPLLITRGMTASQIAEKLKKEGFIRSPLAFRTFVQVTGKSGSIQAGDYRLTKNLSLPTLVNELVEGPIAVWVTLPEGLRREEIVRKVVDALGLDASSQTLFIDEFMALTKNKEGFLFPDTYLFLKTATPSAVVMKLTDTFEKRVDETIEKGARTQNLTLRELVTLASIVERETRTDDERPIVAGILLKRLRAGWPLQADATLQYAVSSVKCQVSSQKCEWWPIITTGDKTIKSQYNTYTNRGLPPAPIANPGLSSIKAVANPQNSPYWFYLHDREGRIHYAPTAEEHAENINKFLR